MTKPSKPAPRRYSLLQVVLHWGVAFLLLFQLVVNQEIRAAFRLRLLGETALWPPAALAAMHIAVGLVILVLMLMRLFLRINRPERASSAHVPVWVHLAAKAAHWALYAVVLGMALAGGAAWLFASPFVATLHEAGRLVLISLVLLHVAGALVEHHLLANPVLHDITAHVANED